MRLGGDSDCGLVLFGLSLAASRASSRATDITGPIRGKFDILARPASAMMHLPVSLHWRSDTDFDARPSRARPWQCLASGVTESLTTVTVGNDELTSGSI